MVMFLDIPEWDDTAAPALLPDTMNDQPSFAPANVKTEAAPGEGTSKTSKRRKNRKAVHLQQVQSNTEKDKNNMEQKEEKGGNKKQENKNKKGANDSRVVEKVNKIEGKTKLKPGVMESKKETVDTQKKGKESINAKRVGEGEGEEGGKREMESHDVEIPMKKKAKLQQGQSANQSIPSLPLAQGKDVDKTKVIDKNKKKSKLAALLLDAKTVRTNLEAALVQGAEAKREQKNVQEKDKKKEPETKPTAAKSGLEGTGTAAKKLEGSRFRWVNEQLYTSDSNNAVKLMAETPELFNAYHKGFRSQVAGWSHNPVDVIITYLNRLPSTYIVGDFGCGEAKIGATARQKVHSFDLVAANDTVTACDIAHVPLPKASLDVAVYCLALMGTNYIDFLRESHRVLKPKGILKIAEVSSRIPDPARFASILTTLGFDHVET
eukprot:Ihof_evm2s468 gene=Ihof_evmTU2s468